MRLVRPGWWGTALWAALALALGTWLGAEGLAPGRHTDAANVTRAVPVAATAQLIQSTDSFYSDDSPIIQVT